MRYLIFFGALTLLLGGTHAYVGRRLTRPLAAERRRRVWVLVALSMLALPAMLVGARVGGSSLMSGAAFVHMGLFTLVFAAFVSFDLVALGLLFGDRLVGWYRGGRPSDALLPEAPERRAALLTGVNLGLLGLAGVQGGVGYANATGRLEVKDVEVPVSGLAPGLDGFTIVQLTDVHVGQLIQKEFVAEVVARVNALDADLVAITGDLVDGSVPELAADVAPLADLRARHGTWFCTGNHEYYSGAEPWVAHLRSMGITVLLNEHRVLQHGGARMTVAGVTDIRAEGILPSHKSDLAAALDGAPDGPFRLLLAHQPASVFDCPVHDVDLQLSGHTHGGQYFPGTILVHLAHPYVRGLHHHEGRTWIYVSCGTGFWGPPMRLGTTAEITRITLRTA